MADDNLRQTLKITFNDWKTDPTLEPSLRNRAAEIVHQTVPNFASIVGGFDKNKSPVFFYSEGAGSVVEIAAPGYCAIGSGGNLAYDFLSYRKQNVHMGIPQSLFHAVEARMFAQIDAWVGGLMTVMLLSKKNKAIKIHLHPKFGLWMKERYDRTKTDYLGEDVEKNIFAQSFNFQF